MTRNTQIIPMSKFMFNTITNAIKILADSKDYRTDNETFYYYDSKSWQSVSVDDKNRTVNWNQFTLDEALSLNAKCNTADQWRARDLLVTSLLPKTNN